LLHGILQVQVLSSAAPEKAQFLLAGRVLWRLLTGEAPPPGSTELSRFGLNQRSSTGLEPRRVAAVEPDELRENAGLKGSTALLSHACRSCDCTFEK